MITLGLQLGSGLETDRNLSGYSNHDSAAVLLQDGKIVAAIEEERLSRIKHCNFFPKRSIDFCLKQAGITLSEVDQIAVSDSKQIIELMLGRMVFENPKRPLKSGGDYISENFETFYGCNVSDKLVYCSHHVSHAWSAFPLSGFEKSLVVILDGDGYSGDGKRLSGLIGVAVDNRFKVLHEITIEDSLGLFYEKAIRFIGYDRFDEYKVMGLAPYGNPQRFRDMFRSAYSLLKGGGFSISRTMVHEMWPVVMKEEGLFRRASEPFAQIHKDFAAALQESLEEIAMHIIRNAQQKTGMDYLSLAGGVAHNCTLNGKIQRSGIFKNVFVQPVAHDAGLALGSAIYAQSLKGIFPVETLDHLYLGTPIPESDHIHEVLSHWKPAVEFEFSQNVCQDVAKLLSENAVIGWVQGRSEYGPRALGNRSILADPRPEENKARINKMIKKREGYRPFAPSVLAGQAPDFFEIDPEAKSLYFMNLIAQVKEDKRQELGAITHVDGSARIQLVKKETNQKYWELINSFYELTGVPILLNTSFNNNAEPIVDSVEDALVCFLTTDLTHLVVDNYIVSKDEALHNFLPHFQLSIRESYRLTAGYKPQQGGFVKSYFIEFNASGIFSKSSEISEKLYRICAVEEGSISDRASQLGIILDAGLLDEIIELWNLRILTLSPSQEIGSKKLFKDDYSRLEMS